MYHSNSARQGGMLEVLRIAMPLVLASSGHAFRLFADRVMLSHYAPESIAASMPSGLTCFTLMSFFIGTAGYANAFIAQYIGAGHPQRVGLAVWQGIYISIAGGIVVAAMGELAVPIFDWMGHAPAVRAEQVRYFQVLARFSGAAIALSTLNAFWSGRGHTRVVMAIELFCAGVNILLNYVLIFGKCGFAERGIAGAGLATGISSVLGLAIAITLFLDPSSRAQYGTLPRHTLDWPLLRRLLRFGLPNGLQFMLDLAAFNLFVVLLGQYGTRELEAANIAFSLNAMAFLPIMGIGLTVSIMVGQGVGAGDIAYAKRAVRSAVWLALIYNATLGGAFLTFPRQILSVFARQGDVLQTDVLEMGVRCLRYITAYLLFDALCVLYSHAIKGAGDTRFAMLAGLALSWGTLALPCYVAVRLGASIWFLWGILVGHVVLAGTVFGLRYRTGRWESMRVIEEASTRT